MSNLLFDEYPLLVNPTLATIIGLNESIVLQQVHYWIKIEMKSKDPEVITKHYHDDRWWIYNTYDQWQEQFPFWSTRTLKRIIKSLENRNLLLVNNYNKFGYDRTKWYTINYDVLESLNLSHSDNLAQSRVTNCHKEKCQSVTCNTIDYANTSSKEYVKCTMVQNHKGSCTNDFSYEILHNQIRTVCEEDFPDIDIEEVYEIISYYCKTYEYYIGKHHPKMKNTHYKRIIDVIDNCSIGIDREGFEIIIDKHFTVDYGKPTDYNMNHFFTLPIIENRILEELY